MHNIEKGSLGEILVIKRLIELDWNVFTPIHHNSKIDVIAIKDQKIKKIQVKTTTEQRNNSIILYLKKSHLNPKYDYVYDLKDLDYFALCFLPEEKVLFIPTTEIGIQKTFNIKLNDEKSNRSFTNYLSLN